MRPEQLPLDQTRRVTTRALVNYARALGWQKVDGVNGKILVYHHPEARSTQVIFPADVGLADYAEVVSVAITRLAEFENRPAQDLLDHLLLPPADLLLCRDTSSHAADGTLPFGEAVDLLVGARKALLAQAHSVIEPLLFHPRLSRREAERFINACRFGQTRRGSFTVVLACPLDAIPTEGNLFDRQLPFTRRVTAGLMRSLALLADAADQGSAEPLLRPDGPPPLSANLCEALTQMRPQTDRPSLTISADWSRTCPQQDEAIPNAVHLTEEVFTIAESLAPRLRTAPQPEPAVFLGYVDVLRGLPGEDDRPRGEVMVTLFQEDELVRAWLNLSAEDYEAANQAHMTNTPVTFLGILYRGSRVGRVERVSRFRKLNLASSTDPSLA
jgi:hypothetical protein